MTPTPTATPVPPLPAVTSELLLSLLFSLLIALGVILGALLIARFARGATLRTLGRTRADPSTRLLIGRVVFVAILMIGGLTALGLVGVPWTTVVALTSVLGLAVSLALQDVLKNFVAGVYLLVERPFRIGESIKVREYVGAVETIDVRTTVLRTPDGDTVMVPNAILFAEIILNRGLPAPVAPAADDADESGRV